jgi:hypothetical protein
MADEDLLKVREDWRRQDSAFAVVYSRLRRNRWRPHLALALEIVSSIVTLVTGLWFAWLAWNLSSLLFGLSAIVLLLATPAFALAAILIRKDTLRWDEETAEGVLTAGLRRANASLRAIRVGRWHVVVIAVFVAVLWVMEAMGLIAALRFLVFYTSVCAAILIPYLKWLAWRERRVRGEREACQRLLNELTAVEI